MRLVLVGVAPTRQGEVGQPLSALGGGRTGARLAALMGLAPLEYMRRTDRVNLCPYPRPGGITVADGRPVAEMLAGSLLRGRRVVLLGVDVVRCFGYDSAKPLVWEEPSSRFAGLAGFRAGRMGLPFTWAYLPHLSGRNRFYNDPVARGAAEEFLRRAVEVEKAEADDEGSSPQQGVRQADGHSTVGREEVRAGRRAQEQEA